MSRWTKKEGPPWRKAGPGKGGNRGLGRSTSSSFSSSWASIFPLLGEKVGVPRGLNIWAPRAADALYVAARSVLVKQISGRGVLLLGFFPTSRFPPSAKFRSARCLVTGRGSGGFSIAQALEGPLWASEIRSCFLIPPDNPCCQLFPVVLYSVQPCNLVVPRGELLLVRRRRTSRGLNPAPGQVADREKGNSPRELH